MLLSGHCLGFSGQICQRHMYIVFIHVHVYDRHGLTRLCAHSHWWSTMQERAQQQIQRLRSLRSTSVNPGGSPASRNGHSNVPERGFAKHSEPTNVPQQSDRLPSKAELRGTLGTVSRKVCTCLLQLSAVSHYPCMRGTCHTTSSTTLYSLQARESSNSPIVWLLLMSQQPFIMH